MGGVQGGQERQDDVQTFPGDGKGTFCRSVTELVQWAMNTCIVYVSLIQKALLCETLRGQQGRDAETMAAQSRGRDCAAPRCSEEGESFMSTQRCPVC